MGEKATAVAVKATTIAKEQAEKHDLKGKANKAAETTGTMAAKATKAVEAQMEKHQVKEKAKELTDKALDKAGVDKGVAKVAAMGAVGVGAVVVAASAIPTA